MASGASPPIPLSTKPIRPSQELTSVVTIVTTETGAGSSNAETTVAGVLGSTTVGLEALRALLEATNTLPFVKYIASIGIQIIQIVIDAQVNNDAFRALSMRARDIVLAVARSCEGMQDMAAQLEKDLVQLTGTMNDILAFASDKIARKRYRKLWNRSEDAAAVKALDTQLNHAFQIFEIQSSVNSRLLQHQMVRQISTLSITPPPPVPAAIATPDATQFIPDIPLRISDGIYFIRSAIDGRVLEIENRKQPESVHVYLAQSREGRLKTQLWYIKGKTREPSYVIQSLATGSVLDIWQNLSISGAHVVGHEAHGGGNQAWTLYGSRPGTAGDFCSIRSVEHQTILDAKCPISRAHCDCLHATSLSLQGPFASQEWILVDLTVTPSPQPAPSLHNRRPSGPLLTSATNKRIFRLQNVSSGSFATYLPDRPDGPNIILQPRPSPATEWTFVYITHQRSHGEPDMFAIATIAPDFLGTIDHWGSRHINVAKFWPTNPYHAWIVIPRDGTFVFKNHASGRLLSAKGDSVVDTMQLSVINNPACHWRLVDALSGETSRILYDPSLSIVPRELSGPPPMPHPLPSPLRPGLQLQTAHATEQVYWNFTSTLQAEQEIIRHLLQSGYSAVVVIPQVLVGWRQGRVSRLKLYDDDDELDQRAVNTRRSMDACMAR